MNWIRFLPTLLLIIAIPSQELGAWSRHFQITERILTEIHSPELERTVKVEPLETFLKMEFKKLQNLFVSFEKYLHDYPYFNYPEELKLAFSEPTKQEFFKALRAREPAYISYAIRDKAQHSGTTYLEPAKAVAGLEYIHPEPFFFKKSPSIVPVSSVIATFTDEPDWGLDIELFDKANFFYGSAPLGVNKGPGSKGIFHTFFGNESLLVRSFASEITKTRAPERVELFFRLAVLAKKTGHEYWAARFLAWSLHYFQDIAQPYHSKAIPEITLFESINYIFSIGLIGDSKQDIKRKKALIVANRHFMLEEIVNELILRPDLYAYGNKDLEKAFSREIFGNFTGATNAMLEQATKLASQACSDLDRVIQISIPEKYSFNDASNLYFQSWYNTEVMLEEIEKNRMQQLVTQISVSLTLTSEITKAVISRWLKETADTTQEF